MAVPNRRRWTTLHIGSDGMHNISLENDLQTAQSLLNDGQYQEAVDLLDNTDFMQIVRICDSPSMLESLDDFDRQYYAVFCHARASILTYMGKDAEAAEWYQRTINAKPNDAEPWSDKAGCHYRLGQYELAIECARKAAEANPQDELAWRWWVKALRAMGDDTQAFKIVDNGLKAITNSGNLLLSKASLLAGRGHFAEAVEITEQVLKSSPNDAAAWYNRGVYLGMLGNHEKALDAFRRATELAPTDEIYWRELAIMLAVLDRPEAETALQEALRLLPGDENATMVLSSLYRARGEPQKSLPYIERALLADPNSEALLDLKEEVIRQLNN